MAKAKKKFGQITTTFRELRELGACRSRYKVLATALGGVEAYGRRTPITLNKILTTNGPGDLSWLTWKLGDALNRKDRQACRDFYSALSGVQAKSWKVAYTNDERERYLRREARKLLARAQND